MEILNFIINNTFVVDNTEKLYYRLSKNATNTDNGISLPNNEYVTLDTYYNVISSKYFYYANLINPTITINYKGNIKVEIINQSSLAVDTICSLVISSPTNDTATIPIDQTKVKDNSLIYLKITSLQDDSMFFGGSFCCDNKPRDIKLGAIICTYHRESFVKANLTNLDNYVKQDNNLSNKLKIFVIDNGQTLKKEDLPNIALLFANENSGGSGGFTRGLREVIKEGSYSHFLFMDDDISLEPSVLKRTINLLSLLKDEYKDYSIGGTMLIKDMPTIQHEFGGYWNGSKIKPNGKGVNLANVEGLLYCEENYNTNYNAWWYCCMPTNYVTKYDYPLEMLFVQFDDVEYGLRNKEEFIHINGIGVWHESFENKYSPTYEYFIRRNNMIVMNRYSNKCLLSYWLKYVTVVSQALFQQRYYVLDIVKLAYDDYLKGADYIKTIKGVDKLKELSKYCPNQVDADTLSKELNLNFDEMLAKTMLKKEKRFVETINLNSYLLPKCTYDDIVVVDMVTPRPIDFYKANKVVHYNKYTQKAFVTTIDKKMLFVGLKDIFAMLIKMLLKFRKAKKSYKAL